MADTIETKFSASLSGGTQQTFATMQKGFRLIAKELQGTAKELLKLQKTEAADAIGHVSLAVNKFANNLTSLSGASRKTTKDLSDLEKTEKHFAQSSELAQQAWAKFRKDIEAGKTSFAVAKARAMEYDKAINNLTVDLKLVGGSERDLAKNIKFADVAMKQQNGELTIAGGRFKNLNTASYTYLIQNKKIAQSVRELHQSTSLYNTTLRNASKIKFGEGQVNAIKELGKQVGFVEEKFKVFVPVLRTTESNLNKLKIAQKALTGENAKWISGVDRAKIANQTLINAQTGVIKHLTQTNQGFKILSLEGLKPFNGLTLTMAQKLGMLDSHFTKFLGNMNLLKASSGVSTAEAKKLTVEILKQSKSFEEASKKSKEYVDNVKQVGKNKDKVAALTVRYNDLLTATGKNSEQARKWIAILAKQPQRLNEVRASLAKLSTLHMREAADLKRAKEASKVLAIQYRDLIASQDAFGNSARKVIEVLKRKGTSLAQVRTKLKQLSQDQKIANNSMSTTEGIVNRLAKSFRVYASYMVSSTMLRGMTQGFRSATAAIIEHDQGLHDLKAIMQATGDEVSRMDTTIMRVAKDTKFSVGETATAMKKLGQAGFTATEAIAGMPNIANLATGTLESLQSAVDLTSTAVRVFQLGMDQTGQVADQFANAVTKSRLTVSKLNIAFNYIGPLAKAAGLSLKGTDASLMLLANSGLRASTIGTGFRRVLSLLLKPSNAFKEAVQKAGYAVDDFNPRLHEFRDIVAKLPKVVTNSQDAIEMFGIRGSSVVTAFTTQGVKEFDRLRATLDKTGTASLMAAEQMKGLGVMLKNIKDRFGVLSVTIGKAGLSDVFRVMVSSVREFLQILIDVAQTGIGQFLIRTTSMIAMIGALGFVFGNVAKIIKTKFVVALKSAVVASKAFLLSAPGILLAITASALILTANAWASYTRKIKKAVTAEAEYSASLETINQKLEKYNEQVKAKGEFSNEAQEAAKILKESIINLGTKTEKTKEIVEKFAGAIDETTGSIKDSKEVLAGLSEVLENETTESYENAIKLTNELYTKQTKLQDVIGKLTLWYDLKKAINFVSETWNKLGKAIDTIDIKLGGIGLNLDKLVSGISTRFPIIGWYFKRLLIEPVQTATEAFEVLKKASEMEGNEKALLAYASITEKVEALTPKILENVDASKLSNEEFEKIAKLYAESNEWGLEAQGALLSEMLEYAENIKKAKTTIEEMGSSTIATYSSIKNGLIELSNEENVTFEKKQKYIDDGLELVRTAAAEELKIAEDKADKELSALSGSIGEQLELEKTHQKNIKDIKIQNSGAIQSLLEERQKVYSAYYRNQLENVKEFFAGEKTLQEEFHTDAVLSNDLLNKQLLATIEERYDDEHKFYVANTQLQLEQQKVQLAEADAHYSAMAVISTKDLETRIEYAKMLPGKEEEINEKVVGLKKDLLEIEISNLKKRKSAYQNTLSSMIDKEVELTQKIKVELDAREAFTKSVDQILLDLKRKTMTEEEVLESKRTEALRLENEARSLMLSGEHEKAKERTKEAIEAHKEVANSIDEQTEGSANYERQVGAVASKIKSLKDTWMASSNAVVSDIDSQKNKVEDFVGVLKDSISELSEGINTTIEQLQVVGATEVELSVDEALANLNTLNSYMNELNEKIIEIKIDDSQLDTVAAKIASVKAQLNSMGDGSSGGESSSEGHREGGPIKANAGTRIPGFGGGDKIDALLEPGEWVIRKEAVAKYGDEKMNQINTMQEPVGFSTGGKPDRKDYRAEIKKHRESNFVDMGGDFYSSPNLSEYLNKYKESGEIGDLFEAFNEYGNNLDVGLINIAQALKAGVGSIGLTAANSAHPTYEERGFYEAEGQEKPNKRDITYILKQVSKNITGGYMMGPETYKAHEALKELHNTFTSSHSRSKEKSMFNQTFAEKIERRRERWERKTQRVRNPFGFNSGGPSNAATSAMNSFTPPASVGALQIAKPSSNSKGPVHKVTFEIGGKNVGPFEANGLTMDSFLSTMKQHQSRA